MANNGLKKARKVKNLGTIYFDNTKKQWIGQIEIGKYENGRSKFKRFIGDSQNSVIDKMRDYQKAHPSTDILEQGNNLDITVEDYFNKFLTTVKKIKLKAASYAREYRTYINNIVPYIGHYKISELNASIIQGELINKLIENKYSFSTVHKVYVLLKEGLNFAYKQGDISSNPCQFVEEPSKKIFTNTKPIRFFDDDEINKFIIAATSKSKNNGNMKYKNGYVIISLIYTGLRGGELMALKWGDINFDGGYISIRKNIAVISRKNEKREVIIQDSTKTKSGRTVYLSKSAKKYLQLAKQNLPESQTQKDCPVFIASGCRDLSSLSQTYELICNRAGISDPQGVHTLRHTCASLLIRKDVDIKIISEMLGHSSVSFTYNTYVHLLEEHKAKTIGELDL